MFDQSVFLRKTGGGESGNRVRPIREWPLRLPHPSLSNVRVHDQFYPQAQAPARKVYDEQRSREFHYPTGKITSPLLLKTSFLKYKFAYQVVTNRDTQETLLCVAYVFEVSTSEHGAQHHIYRLVKD